MTHPLETWLAKQGMPKAQFAAHIGSSKAHVSNIISGKSSVSIAKAIAIEDATSGAVSVRDLAEYQP